MGGMWVAEPVSFTPLVWGDQPGPGWDSSPTPVTNPSADQMGSVGGVAAG
jgi:hypothetical protein